MAQRTMLPQVHLNWLDYSVIGLYGAVIVILGIWFARQQRTSEDYLLGGRSMGWIVVGISQLASLLSTISYLGSPGEAYGHGLRYLFYSICRYLVIPSRSIST